MLVVLLKKTDYNIRAASIDTKISSFDDKITKNKHKLEDAAVNTIILFLGKSIFDEGRWFSSLFNISTSIKYFQTITNTNYISSWKSRGLCTESIKPFPTSDNIPTPLIDYYNYKIKVKFNGSFLRQPKVTFTHGKVVNIFIVYELVGSSFHSDDPTLKNCLFGAATLVKNADFDKYGYFGYGISFDRKSSFSFLDSGFGQNVLILGVHMSSSSHIDNIKKIY